MSFDSELPPESDLCLDVQREKARRSVMIDGVMRAIEVQSVQAVLTALCYHHH